MFHLDIPKVQKEPNSKPRPIKIMYPKKRDGLSISFRDRVYQRSINDNALYPMMTKHFIYDNWACQQGKGPDKARERLIQFLRKYYINHGSEGYVLQLDVKGYYPNMSHESVKKVFSKYLPKDVLGMVCDVLDTQYKGNTGYNPGSQMVQIAGISLLNDIDHYIKEQLHIKYYIRYMDDMLLILDSEESAIRIKNAIEHELLNVRCRLNNSKTKIIRLRKGFMFLGFKFRLTESGKVIVLVDPKNVKHERQKLYRMVQKAKRGEMTKAKVDECYQSWRDTHAVKGKHYKLFNNLDNYYKQLWR